MMILPAIVLVAEGFVALWFVLFLWLVTSGYLDGRGYRATKHSRVEFSFLKHVQHFVILGIATVVVLSSLEMVGLIDIE